MKHSNLINLLLWAMSRYTYSTGSNSSPTFNGGHMKNRFGVIKNFTLITVLSAGISACAPQPSSEYALDISDSTENIVNGAPVKPSDVLSHSTVALYAALPLRGGGTQFSNFCTGTLISRELILTAAHCFADFAAELHTDVNTLARFVYVGFGTDVATSLEDSRVKFKSLKSLTVHQAYRINSVRTATSIAMHDIALIRISSEAPSEAKTALLPLDSSNLRKGANIILVGFGLTDGVQQTSAVRMNRVTVKIDNPEITETQFTYKVINGKSACSGDSGGPAYIKNRTGSVSVVGVTSWGDNTCTQLGAYTSVASHIPWIKETAQLLMAN